MNFSFAIVAMYFNFKNFQLAAFVSFSPIHMCRWIYECFQLYFLSCQFLYERGFLMESAKISIGSVTTETIFNQPCICIAWMWNLAFVPAQCSLISGAFLVFWSMATRWRARWFPFLCFTWQDWLFLVIHAYPSSFYTLPILRCLLMVQ